MQTGAAFVEAKTGNNSIHFKIAKILSGLQTVILGKQRFLEYLVTCLIAGGHVLIEDIPGLGKTTVAKTLANLITSGKNSTAVFRRIQFTPDLLPYDITGVDVFDPEKKKFVFTPGPVFANIVLADEINRTSPKVQSALLETMAENQVTVGTRTHKLDPFFFVIATQNPVEIEGTYPLSLAQTDRFFMRLSLGYPDPKTEYDIIKNDPSRKIMPNIKFVCEKKEILAAREEAEAVFCDDRLIKTAVSISGATRIHSGVELGVSPRGSLMLIQAAKTYAFIKERDYVIDQDIIDLAPLVLAHRLKLKDTKLNPESLIREITLAKFEEIQY